MRRGDSLNVSRGNKTPSRWEGLGRSESNLMDEEKMRARARPGKSPGPVRPAAGLPGEVAEQDAAILASVRNDDMKIRNGTALLKPSEIRNRTPGKKPKVDWGECPLTFDAIKIPVRAGDGHVYEKWAIEKWLLENENRSPLTNVKIDPTLQTLTDADQGSVRGARHVSPERASIKTEINTILNTVRGSMEIDEVKYTAPGASASAARQPTQSPSVAGAGAVRAASISSNRGVSGRANESMQPEVANGVEDEQALRNKQIAAIMRDTSIPAADKQRRIQEIRSGKKPEEPEPDHLAAAATPSRAGGSSASQPAEQTGGEAEDEQTVKNRKIAAIMRDPSIPAADKQRRIQEIRTGKKVEEPDPTEEPGHSARVSHEDARRTNAVTPGPLYGNRNARDTDIEASNGSRNSVDGPPVLSPKPSSKPKQSNYEAFAQAYRGKPEQSSVPTPQEEEPAAKTKSKFEEEKEEEQQRLEALKKKGFKGYDPSSVNSFGSDWRPPNTIAVDNVEEVAQSTSPNKLDPSKLKIGGRDQSRSSQEQITAGKDPKDLKPSPKPSPLPAAPQIQKPAVQASPKEAVPAVHQHTSVSAAETSTASSVSTAMTTSSSKQRAAIQNLAAPSEVSMPTTPSRPSFPGMSSDEMKAIEQESMAMVQAHLQADEMAMPFKDQAAMDAAIDEASQFATPRTQGRDRASLDGAVATLKHATGQDRSPVAVQHLIPEDTATAKQQHTDQAAAGRKGMLGWLSGNEKNRAQPNPVERSNTFSEFHSDAPADSGMVGVGITFGQYVAEHAHGGGLFVKLLQEGGPAHASQQVLLGDMLFEVDGVNVYKRSVNRIQGKILGPANSVVDLVFKRSPKTKRSTQSELSSSCSEPLEKLETVYVTLTRKAPPPGHKFGLVPDAAVAVASEKKIQQRSPKPDPGGVSGQELKPQTMAARDVKAELVIPFGIDNNTRPRPDASSLPGRLKQVSDIEAKQPAIVAFGKESSAFREMYDEGDFLDLTICCNDNQNVKAHRVLMAACSPQIRQMLRKGNGQFNPMVSVRSTTSESTISFADCPGWAIQAVVDFIYKGRVRASGALEIFEMYRIAKMLQISSLQEAAEDGLMEMLKTDTCCDLMTLATANGVLRLAEACRLHLLKHFAPASRTSGFLKLEEDVIEGLLRSESLQARKEEEIFDSLLTWMLNDNSEAVASGKIRLRGERLARHIRFATMSTNYLQKLQGNSFVTRNPKLKAYVDQGVAVKTSGASAQPRPLVGSSSTSSPSQSQAKEGKPKPARSLFTFDSSRSHMNHSIREAGMKSVLREDGDSEQSALLSPAIPRNGRHFVEFLLENTGTPDCYIQVGVCTGSHDVAGGTPAYQSDSGWCFSCHNGNILHYDHGAEYSKKLPREGDRVGLMVDMDARTLEIFVNSQGQGVMVRNLPDTLFFVVDAGDKGQAIRIMPPNPAA